MSEPAVKYSHSGAVGYSPFVLLLVGLPACLAVAVAYAYILVYCPVVGYVNVLFVAGYVFGAGFALGHLAKAGKCRSTGFVVFASSLISLVSFYVSWVFFIYAMLNRYMDAADAPSLAVCFAPGLLWKLICALNEDGWYSIFGGTPSGTVLWVMWGIEALILVIGPIVIAPMRIAREMFCERCFQWCGALRTHFLNAPAELIGCETNHIDATDLAALEPFNEKQYPCIQGEVLKCPTCDDTAGLRYAILQEKVDKAGKTEENAENIPGIYLTSTTD